MNCTVEYGLGRDIKRSKEMPVEEAFRNLKELMFGWNFLNIYYQGYLVYTTQGDHSRYVCDDCPYSNKSKTVTKEQYSAIYGG